MKNKKAVVMSSTLLAVMIGLLIVVIFLVAVGPKIPNAVNVFLSIFGYNSDTCKATGKTVSDYQTNLNDLLLKKQNLNAIKLYKEFKSCFPDKSISDQKILLNLLRISTQDTDIIYFYEELIKLDPKPQLEEIDIYHLSMAYYNSGKLDQALVLFEKYKKDYPTGKSLYDINQIILLLKEYADLKDLQEITLISQYKGLYNYNLKYTDSITYKYEIFDYGSSSTVSFYKKDVEFQNSGPQAVIFDKIKEKIISDLYIYCSDNLNNCKKISSVNPPILWPKPPKSELDTLKESSISSIVPIWNNINQKRYIITYENKKVYTYDAIYDSVLKKATISFYRGNKGTDITDTNKMWITSGQNKERETSIILQIMNNMNNDCTEMFDVEDPYLKRKILNCQPKP